MPMALPARRADLYFFSRAMRSRSPRVFAMLTTLVHFYLHMVVDFLYISWIYTACGDRTNPTWCPRADARRRARTDGAPPSPTRRVSRRSRCSTSMDREGKMGQRTREFRVEVRKLPKRARA